jgi:hypothetical protein
LLLLMKGQHPVWLADSDELLYLAVGGQSYFDHPLRLADPILPGHSGLSMFPWIQFAPGILAARVLHAGPLAISFFWRAFAGFSMGLGFFLVMWKIVRRPWLAAACTMWMLSDAGTVTGQPLFQQLADVRKLAVVRGDFIIPGEPQILRLWRIITPGLSLVYLLVFLFALLHARASPSRRSTVIAGMAFGLLFYVYFYYWTAAGLALVICAVLGAVFDQELRRASILAGAIGCVIGIPAVVSGFLLKNSTGHDWLQRTDNFVSVPHFSGQLWFIVPDCLLIASLVWILLWRRDLIPVWALAFSGMILANHQILTGLQIQNYHYVYVFGPVFSLLVMSAFVSAAWCLQQRRPLLVKCGVGVLCIASLLSGLWLRAVEAELTVVPLKLQEDLQAYRSQREGAPGGVVARLAPDSVIAGDPMFLDLAAIVEDQRPLTHYAVLFSPSISNREWDRRDALNAYLTGQAVEEFVGHQREFFEHLVYGPTVRDMAARELRVENREKEFDEIIRDPAGALREFNVRYLALTGDQKPPEAVASEFALTQRGPTWTIWEREKATRQSTK